MQKITLEQLLIAQALHNEVVQKLPVALDYEVVELRKAIKVSKNCEGYRILVDFLLRYCRILKTGFNLFNQTLIFCAICNNVFV